MLVLIPEPAKNSKTLLFTTSKNFAFKMLFYQRENLDFPDFFQ